MSIEPTPLDPSQERDVVVVTEHRTWFERLGGAVAGAAFGILVVIAACALMVWNEGRAAGTAQALAEGQGIVVEADSLRVEPANEGRLVHLDGDLSTGAPLVDRELMVTAKAGRLHRAVEVYEWHEESRTTSQKELGGGQTQVTTYVYTRAWTDRHQDSGHFHDIAAHRNPVPRYAALDVVAQDAAVGRYRAGQDAVVQLDADRPLAVDPAVAVALRRAGVPGNPVVLDGKLLIADDPANPAVGDLRITYSVAPEGRVSVVARQTGDRLTAYTTHSGGTLLMAVPGAVPAAAMFRSAERSNAVLTWLLRVVAVLALWLGFFLILRPIAVAGDVVPALGTLLGAGILVASLVLTLALAPVVIVLSWLLNRSGSVAALLAVLAVGWAMAVALQAIAARRRALPV